MRKFFPGITLLKHIYLPNANATFSPAEKIPEKMQISNPTRQDFLSGLLK